MNEDDRRSRGCPKWLTYLLGLTTTIFLVLTIIFAVKMNDKDKETITVKEEVEVPVIIPHPAAGDGVTSGMHLYYNPFNATGARGVLAVDQVELSPNVEEIFQRLSYEHKVGQLLQWAKGDLSGPSLGDDSVESWLGLIGKGQVGSVLNLVNPIQNNLFQEAAIKTNGVPILVGFDVIHGHRTIAPVNLGLAASFDPKMVEDFSRDVAAEECSAEGVRWTFAPMLDVSRDPRWGRMSESWGEDSFMSGQFGAATVRGFQGYKPKPVAACAKHIAAYGAVHNGKDYTATEMSWNQYHNHFFEGYVEAIKAGVMTTMASFNTVNGLPAHGNRELQTDVVRGMWGFRGMCVSDYNGIAELGGHEVASTEMERSLLSLTAGVDMDMASGDFLHAIAPPENEAIVLPDGHTIGEYVNLAARRVLWVKQELGLFEDNGMLEVTDNTTIFETIHCTPEKLAMAQRAAEESAVLLKNSGGTLPIDFNTAGKTLLVGRLADDVQAQIGSWSGAGGTAANMLFKIKTVLVAANERFGCSLSAETPTDAGCTKFDYYPGYAGQINPDPVNDERLAAEVVKAIEEKTYGNIVLVLGENHYQHGEGSSRAHLELPHYQSTLVRQVKAAVETLPAGTTKPKITLVLMVGRPNIISWEAENLDAILVTWNSGTMGGIATWNLLAGDKVPSGKLPVTFPRAVGQIPIHYAEMPSGRPIPPGLDKLPYEGMTDPLSRFVARYIDEYTTPLYPFGYGLSYNTYTYTTPTISPSALQASAERTPIKIHVSVNKVGGTTRATTEIVQIYVKKHKGLLSPPSKRLRAFKRVEFAVGVSTGSADFELNLEDDFAAYDAQLKRRIEPGHYTIFVAKDSSDETHPLKFEITK